MVRSLPHRIMRLVLLLSAKIGGAVDIFLIVFVCVCVREGEGGGEKQSGILFTAEEQTVLTMVTAKRSGTVHTVCPAAAISDLEGQYTWQSCF